MSASSIQDILQQIDALPEDDRLLLEERLSERLEAEWRQECEQARRIAQLKGIDQGVIDHAVGRQRHVI
jgi:hypothetical protein